MTCSFYTRGELTYTMSQSLLFLSLTLGLLVGSFVAQAASNVILGKPISLFSRSSCHSCGKILGFWDLLPMVSYFLHGKRCRHCKEEISNLYWQVEFATSFFFALGTFQLLTAMGTADLWQLGIELGFWFFVVSMGLYIASIDLKTKSFPVAGLMFSALLVTLAQGVFQLPTGLEAGFMGVGVFSILLMFQDLLGRLLLNQPAVGEGDYVLAIFLGSFLGPVGALTAYLMSVFAGSGFGLMQRARTTLAKREPFPFAPFLVFSSLLVYMIWPV